MDDRSRRTLREGDERERVLRNRLRAGELSLSLLRLAARCGHEPAARALDRTPGTPVSAADYRASGEQLRDWARATLTEQGPEIWALALVGATRVHPVASMSAHEQPRTALAALERWGLDPSPAHAAEVLALRYRRALWTNCDDRGHVLNHAAMAGFRIVAGESSADSVASSLVVQTHPVGGSDPKVVAQGVLEALRAVWEPAL